MLRVLEISAQSGSRVVVVATLLALAVVAAACTTTGPAPSRVDRAPDGGFTVSQDVRVGAGVRKDFEAALALLDEGDSEAGIARLRDVAHAVPQLVAVHVNLAIAYRRVRDFDAARTSAERALELSPRHPVALNELGMIQRHQGRFEEARVSYERALDVSAEFHFARRNLAILCDLFLNDLDCALQHYERYAQALPDDEQVGIWIADLRQRTGKSAGGER